MYRPEVTVLATNTFLNLCAAKTDNADPMVIAALEKRYEELTRLERDWINRQTGRETRYEDVQMMERAA